MASRRLRDDPAYRRYWLAHAVSSAGSTVSLVVLPVLMFQRTGSPFLTASLGAVYIAPYLLLGLFAGALADRLNRRALMVGCSLLSAVALGSVPLAGLVGVLSAGQLLAVTAVTGAGFVGFDAGQWGALPALFGRERLVMALTALAAVDSTLSVAGTSAAGALAATLGAAPAVWLDAGSFLVSAALIASIRGPFSPVASRGKATGWRRWRAEIAEGVLFLWRQPMMRALTLAGTAASLTGGAVMGLLVVYAVRQLGLGPHDARLGLLFGAGGAGTLLATTLLPRLVRRVDVPRLNLVSRAVSLIFAAGLAAVHWLAAALAVYLAFSAAETLAIRSAITYRQLHTPDRLQGRVNVVGRMAAISGQPAGSAIGGALAQVTSVRTALLIMTLPLLASAFGGAGLVRGAQSRKTPEESEMPYRIESVTDCPPPGDRSQTLELIQAIQEEPPYSYAPSEHAPAAEWFPPLTRLPGARLYLALLPDEHTAGYCLTLPLGNYGLLDDLAVRLGVDPAGCCYIAEVGVASGSRRLGIARALLRAALSDRQPRPTGYLVRTLAGNDPAIGLYRSLGFEQVPEVTQMYNGRLRVFLRKAA